MSATIERSFPQSFHEKNSVNGKIFENDAFIHLANRVERLEKDIQLAHASNQFLMLTIEELKMKMSTEGDYQRIGEIENDESNPRQDYVQQTMRDLDSDESKAPPNLLQDEEPVRRLKCKDSTFLACAVIAFVGICIAAVIYSR